MEKLISKNVEWIEYEGKNKVVKNGIVSRVEKNFIIIKDVVEMIISTSSSSGENISVHIGGEYNYRRWLPGEKKWQETRRSEFSKLIGQVVSWEQEKNNIVSYGQGVLKEECKNENGGYGYFIVSNFLIKKTTTKFRKLKDCILSARWLKKLQEVK